MPLPASSSRVILEWLTKTVTPDTLGTLSAGVADDASSMTLNGGFDTLPGGAQPVLIGSELVIVTQSSATLTVEPLGRGYFGSTASAHLSGATVSIANLSSIVGTDVYEFSPPQGWPNATPSLIYSIQGGVPDPISANGTSYLFQPFVQFICYGGQDTSGSWPELACDFAYLALMERIETTAGAGSEAQTSGRLVSISSESASQLIYDQDVKPPQPKILTFASAQII